MIKFIFILIFIFFILINNYLCFIYNYFFFLRFYILIIKIDNYYNNTCISIIFRLNYYSYNLILIIIWIFGLIYLILNKYNLFEKYIFLIIIIILIIFFIIKNLLIFYFFFEISLIPIFFIVIYLGYNFERLRSAYYILIYTLLISLPILIYIIKIFKIRCTWDFFLLKIININLRFWRIFLIIGSFLVKIPIYIFHIWLPKAHVEAPVYGSIVLASILLKLGSYGLIQILIIFLKNILIFTNLFMRIGLVGRLIIRLICLIQIDIKRIIAYSSVVHINMILCILIRYTKIGFMRAYIIIISHGLCSSGLFYIVNLYYIRSSRRLILFNKGLINLLPLFICIWFILCCTNFSFPLSIRFFGEIFLIMVIVRLDKYLLLYLVLIILLRRSYSLYLFLYIYHGEINLINKFNRGNKKDIIVRILHFLPLIILIINIYIY